MESRARTTKDVKLSLRVDIDVADTDVDVVLTVTPATTGSSVDVDGWQRRALPPVREGDGRGAASADGCLRHPDDLY
jgi:hypothetical protein